MKASDIIETTEGDKNIEKSFSDQAREAEELMLTGARLKDDARARMFKAMREAHPELEKCSFSVNHVKHQITVLYSKEEE